MTRNRQALIEDILPIFAGLSLAVANAQQTPPAPVPQASALLQEAGDGLANP